MRPLSWLSFCVLTGALLCSAALLGSPELQAQSSRIAPRITTDVDESSLATLRGNVPRLARAEYDQGEASPATQLTHIRLVLSRSAEQQAALDEYLAELQDKSSPNYHKWLTPEEFGQLYGPADSDIAALVAWLQSHGLEVETVAKGRTNIAFSGTVSLVEEAFHTSIHSFTANGKQFYSNTTDPQIPSALAPVVMGVAHLNTIRPKPLSVHGSPGHINPETRRLEPLSAVPANGPRAGLTGGSGTKSNPYTLYLVPGDAATIYDTPNAYNAAFSSGTSYTGAGVKIGVGGDATISASIVQTYRSLFLGNSTAPTINYCISTSSSPGYSCSSSSSGTKIGTTDSDEAYIDTELSGGIAPGASIYYYASEDLNTGIEAAIDTNVVDIFSLSFGECESQLGSSNNSLINGWWSQAAGQGIAVTVSTGDSGSAGCDDDNTQESAKDGLAVSGFASTPYNIAVGGTDFYPLVSSYSTYASTSLGTAGAPTYYRTAKSYIPESTWNDSPYINTTISANEPWSANGYPTSDNNIIAGGGGASGVYSKPTTWQVATGVPSDGKRDLPDVSLMAGNEFDDAIWVVCDDETYNLAFSTTEKGVLNCSNISGGYFDAYGGTSTSAPTFAGILALVEQKTGGRLGLPANELYSLYGTAPSAFHDVIVGNNSVYCKNPSANCVEDSAGYYFESGYDTTTGYDQATGLGSVDATKLVNAWSSTTGSAKAAVTVDVTTTPPVTIADPVDVTVTVASSPSGGTTPTGTVTLTSGSYNSGAQTLSSGSYTFTVPAGDLAIGTDTLTATYSGDSTYAAATGSTTVTVNGLAATVTVIPQYASISSNQTLTVTGTVASSPSGGTTPTGTVTLTSGSYTSAATALTGTGSYSITIPANSLASEPSPGELDRLTVTYSGNSIYATATNSATVTVTSMTVQTPTVTVTPASGSIDSSQSLNVTVSVAGVTGYPAPTGTVTLTSGSYNSGVVTLSSSGSCTAASCIITIPANSLNSILGGSIDTLTATYSGDGNYTSGVGTASVTVTKSIFALQATNIASLAPGATTGNTSTVTVSSATFYTGTITLSCVLTSPTNLTDPPTCSGGSSTVTLNFGTPTPPGTATVTVSTTAASSELVWPKLPGKGRGLFGAGGGAVLAFLVFLGIPARRRSWRSMLGVLVVMAALGSLAGCGGSSHSSTPGTTAGTYTFTVTGTGNDPASTTETTTFTVNVN
jgi:hypothetical protein